MTQPRARLSREELAWFARNENTVETAVEVRVAEDALAYRDALEEIRQWDGANDQFGMEAVQKIAQAVLQGSEVHDDRAD